MTVTLPINPRTMPDGVVLTFSVRFRPEEGERPNPVTYTYVALKSGGYWYLTGANTPHMAGWSAVERWLERDNRELVRVEIQTGSRTIWPVPIQATVGEPVHRDLTKPHPMDSFGIVIDTPQA